MPNNNQFQNLNQAKGQVRKSKLHLPLKTWQWVSVLVLIGVLISLFFIGDELLFLIFHRPSTPPVQFNVPTSKACIKKLCILDQGKRFNEKCEGREVVLNDLYLYPLTETETFTNQDSIILYSSDSLNVSPTIYKPHLFFNQNKDVAVISISIDEKTDKGKELFQKVANKLDIIRHPVRTNVTGVIQSSKMGPGYTGGWRWGFYILLKKISFPTASEKPAEEVGFHQLTISALADNPKSYLNKKIQITGELINTKDSYFPHPEFALTDGIDEFPVSSWAPFEVPPPPSGSKKEQPATMQDYLNQGLILQGEVKEAVGKDYNYYLSVQSAQNK